MSDGFSHYEITRNRRTRVWPIFFALLVVAAAIWFAFDTGRQRAGYDGDVEVRRIATLEQRITQLGKENAELRDKLGLMERGAAVDKEAYGQIERSLKALQDENYALKQKLTVFQSIVAADSESEQVSIQQFRLMAGGAKRQFHYRLDLTQMQSAARRVKGKVTFQIEGVRDGKEQSAPMSLLTHGRVNEREFSFRQLQVLEGDIVVPDNFEPLRARVRISVLGKSGTKPVHQIEKIFKWADVTG